VRVEWRARARAWRRASFSGLGGMGGGARFSFVGWRSVKGASRRSMGGGGGLCCGGGACCGGAGLNCGWSFGYCCDESTYPGGS
jgi:hypothetical protein